uniref:NADH-ubiquinone oxidoreductase chain 2 n=1 Tax=Callionymus maculatus TaxID=508551 RepID=A0A7H1R6H0_9TELE|nr:NADH dehydrogenase subunit 2 [Callionymus maculatus]
MTLYVYPFVMLSLFAGTIITITSSSWLLAWMGIEMGTLAMLPQIIYKHHPRAVEAGTKYFIVQSMAAGLLMFSSVMEGFSIGEWTINAVLGPFSTLAFTLAFALKLGIAPAHFWVPDVLQGLDLHTGMIMSTWQKIAPLALLLSCNLETPTLLILGGLSVLMGGLGGLNQTQTRKILAYSSISHLGWMLIASTVSRPLAFLALILYIISTYAIFFVLRLSTAKTINALATSWAKNKTLLISTPLILFSLGGLPPILGFLPKWAILAELTAQNFMTISLFVAMASLLSLYFYTRVLYAMATTKTASMTVNQPTWRLILKARNWTLVTFIMMLLFLPLASPALLVLFN